ncbi:MAG: type IV toxin-antitoxin system AbiEi family antitoxin domain-containing protein [Blastocatellia bacterium]|nr:type IV toxin-antitoxin system AbiEi family antitoxin domain-containing protein [Blastocatellia bacterium]
MHPPLERIHQLGGTVRTSQALALGIHPRTLYRLRDEGKLIELSRGVFRSADLPWPDQPDLVSVSVRVPKAVICLISAFAFHHLTTRIPHWVDIALPQGVKTPRVEHPSIRAFHVAPTAYEAGIETHPVDGVPVRIYSAEKTIADGFKFRNRIGLEVVLEALRNGLERDQVTVARILHFARLCRVERVITPYLEALA